jgi:regulator of sigma E protease
LLVAVLAAVVYLISRNIGAFANILLAVVGFGAVVLVHEFGHFVVAKLSKIKVEAFSIGFPPIFAGILRTENGYRVRILPKFFPKQDDESGEGALSFTVGKAGMAWETECRICLIPFGGYVKMLGQEDVGAAEATADPRSYANRPVGVRMAVIAAGVLFNIISAVIAFVIVFLIGINLTPPVIGAMGPDSPAAYAGLRPGDEVIEIAGKSKNLEFMDIQMAAALSGRGQATALRVRHEDGSEEDLSIVAERQQGARLKEFGVRRPLSLTIANVSDANSLLNKTGLLPGDRIRAVNGREVRSHWELEQIVQNTLTPTISVLAERTRGPQKGELVKSEVSLDWMFAVGYEADSESELYHIYSMVPRLRVTRVSGRRVSLVDKFRSLLGKRDVVDSEQRLQVGDIILSVGDVENPTYKEFRDAAEAHDGKKLPIRVSRADANGIESVITVMVEPARRPDMDRVEVGVGVALDAEHPVVAKTILAENGPAALPIPRGAVITSVDGVKVSSFYDVVRELGKHAGRRISIDYRLDAKTAGSAALEVDVESWLITVRPDFAEFVPFGGVERLYKARSPVGAVVMGCRKTVTFITWAYLTLKAFAGGLVSAKEFMGPVGVVTLGYIILTEKPLINYVYILGLISAFIGVLNSVPVLPFDGGHILFLLVEKIKGSPVSEKVQAGVAYAGLVLVGALALYITFNDIIKSFLWLSE